MVDWFSTHAAEENPFPPATRRRLPSNWRSRERMIINELSDYGTGLLIWQAGRLCRGSDDGTVVALHLAAGLSPRAMNID